MREENLVIGMKVKIPKTKSVGDSLRNSNVINKALKNNQDYLFFSRKVEEGYLLDYKPESRYGDYFLLQDIEPYEEKVFILPKDWCIKVDEENVEILTKWLKQKEDYMYSITKGEVKEYVISNRHDGSYQNWSGSKPDDYTEITTEQFKSHVLMAEIKETYSIKELETSNEILLYLDNKEEHDKVKKLTANLISIYCGQYCYSLNKGTYCSTSSKNNIGNYKKGSKIITIDQIKELNMKQKELIGYKLIKPEYEEAALLLCIKDGKGWAKDRKYHFSNESIAYHNAIKARILDLWFEPVFFEEEFKIGDWVSFYSETNKKFHTAKITKLGSSYHYLSDGTEPFVHLLRKATEEEIAAATHKTVKLSIGKNVDIGRDKLSNQVFIIAEGKTIQYKHINNLYCNTNTFGDTGWKIQYNTFDIGCWKNITREDLKLIIDAYEEINV